MQKHNGLLVSHTCNLPASRNTFEIPQHVYCVFGACVDAITNGVVLSSPIGISVLLSVVWPTTRRIRPSTTQDSGILLSIMAHYSPSEVWRVSAQVGPFLLQWTMAFTPHAEMPPATKLHCHHLAESGVNEELTPWRCLSGRRSRLSTIPLASSGWSFALQRRSPTYSLCQVSPPAIHLCHFW